MVATIAPGVIASNVPATSNTPWDALWVVLGSIVFLLIVFIAAGVAAQLEKRHR